jgi:hypothetical protein
MTRRATVHIRLTTENGSTLCGADPREGSQSVLGVCLQTPQPSRQDYCPACVDVLDRTMPAVEAFTHLPIRSCLGE